MGSPSLGSAAVCLAVLAVVVGSLPSGALFVTAGARSASSPVAVVGDAGSLNTLAGDGATSSLGVSAAGTGPMADIDGDGRLEAPFVNGDGEVRLVDAAGETQTLATGAHTSKTRLAVGTWNGSSLSVFYAGPNDYVRRVAPGGDSVRVSDQARAKAVAGIADVDGDGADELVYTGTSQTVKYLDDDGSAETTGVGAGSSGGIGVGAPHDFDGDGVARVPVVDGGNDVVFAAHDGATRALNASAVSAAKTPVAVVDWRGDATPEVLYRDSSTGSLAYVGLDGSQGLVDAADGSSIPVDSGLGVASVHQSPPSISDYAVTNPEGREVRVAFDSTKRLSGVDLSISGAESASLSLSAFSVSGSGPYRYVATYTGGVDGEYTATLVSATGDGGLDGASDQSGTVTVETSDPAVGNVTLADATNGDGLLAAGERVRVTADVTATANLTSVTADLSAFGAGTVSLAREGGVWAANATVADDASQGNATATVEATNEYGATDSAESGAVTVDTEAPALSVGPNRTIEEDTSETFGADATDLTAVSYEWSFPRETATGESVTHVFDDPGTYTVTVTATDAAGNAAAESVAVNVTDVAEETVTLDAGANRTVTEDTRATFDAASANIENATFEWDFGDGTTATGESVTHTYADPGTYTVTLTASNDSGVVATDSLTVRVEDAAEPTVSLDAGADRTVTEDTRSTFQASTTGLSDATLEWDFGDGTTATGESVTHTYGEAGTYTVSVEAIGDSGVVATDSLTVWVEDATEPTYPLDAGPNRTADEDTRVTFVAGGLPTVENATFTWQFPNATATGESATHVFDDPGTYTVTVAARNDSGVVDTDAVTVDVLDVTEAPTDVSLDAGVNRTLPVGTTATFDADGVPPTRDVAYEWTFPNATLPGETVTYAFDEAGTYAVTVTVRDDSDVVATDEVTVTVEADDENRTDVVVDRETASLSGGENETVDFENTSVRRISFENDTPAGDVTVREMPALPPNASGAPGVVFSAWNISVPWDERSGDATVEVSIGFDSVLSAEHVYLAHRTNGTWHLHDAERTGTDGDETKFAGRTSEFSMFAAVYYPDATGGDGETGEDDGSNTDDSQDSWTGDDETDESTPTETPSPTPTSTPAPDENAGDSDDPTTPTGTDDGDAGEDGDGDGGVTTTTRVPTTTATPTRARTPSPTPTVTESPTATDGPDTRTPTPPVRGRRTSSSLFGALFVFVAGVLLGGAVVERHER